MEVTSRYWTAAGLGPFLALWGVAVAQPLSLFGAASVAGWLVAGRFRIDDVGAAITDDRGLRPDPGRGNEPLLQRARAEHG